MYVRKYLRMYVYVCMYVRPCMYVCKYACMYVCWAPHIVISPFESLSHEREWERERERATGHICYMNANTQFCFAGCQKSKLSDHRPSRVLSLTSRGAQSWCEGLKLNNSAFSRKRVLHQFMWLPWLGPVSPIRHHVALCIELPKNR